MDLVLASMNLRVDGLQTSAVVKAREPARTASDNANMVNDNYEVIKKKGHTKHWQSHFE